MHRKKSWIPHLEGKNFDEAFKNALIRPVDRKITQTDFRIMKILHADSTRSDILESESVDLIITSPPYNVGMPYNGNIADDSVSYEEYKEFSCSWLANCYHWAKTTARLCVNVSIDKNKNGKQPLSADITQWAMNQGWKYHATILWNEGNISCRTAWGSWKSASAPHIIAPVETIIIFYKDHWKRKRQGENDITADEFKKWVLGIWNFNGESGKRIGHDAPFPLELPRRLIKLLSFKNDIVLDPFLGSGSTLIEAINNFRQAIGIELENKYCKLSVNRIKKLCGVKLKVSRSEKRQLSIKN